MRYLVYYRGMKLQETLKICTLCALVITSDVKHDSKLTKSRLELLDVSMELISHN